MHVEEIDAWMTDEMVQKSSENQQQEKPERILSRTINLKHCGLMDKFGRCNLSVVIAFTSNM